MPPRFVPPIRYDLLDLVAAGKLRPLDLVIYQDVLAHSDNWVISNTHLAKRYGVTTRTVERSVARLKLEKLLGDGDRYARGCNGPAKLSRSGQYRAPTVTSVGRTSPVGTFAQVGTTDTSGGDTEEPSMSSSSREETATDAGDGRTSTSGPSPSPSLPPGPSLPRADLPKCDACRQRGALCTYHERHPPSWITSPGPSS
jgi:hypothetical protein